MAPSIYIATFLAISFACLTHLFLRRRQLRQLQGPPCSFLWGNIAEIPFQNNVGDCDFKWIQQYGTACRIGGTFGEDILMLADPKGLQYILHKSGYNYPKNVEAQVFTGIVTGRGIIWAQGTDHKRHRKVMSPAFTAPQLESFLPLFRRSSMKMVQQWRNDVTNSGSTMLVNKWIARLTLDIIGKAAFDFDFGALDSDANEVSDAYNNMFVDSMMHPTKWNTIFRASWRYLPQRILDYVDYIPTREYKRFRHTLHVVDKVSKQLIHEKKEALLAGSQTNKDVMSVLVRANVSENPNSKLTDEEMIAQMSTLTLAGHETTATTLTWYLWELSKHPEFQSRLREEIMEVRDRITARGETELTIDDLDSMTYLQAGMKETLRYHPIVYHIERAAGRDDVIPLAYPIRNTSGEMVTEIPVKKGQHIMMSICAYNRLTDVWGEDAHEWNPMRWVDNDSEKQVKIGTYSNVLSFSAGLRACIGWRFSVIEMQAIMFDLVEHFKFAFPDKKIEILRVPSGIMGPMVKDKEDAGLVMPLHVTPV